MAMFIQFTIVGICMGLIYALMALGFLLLVRSVDVLNFAQGDLMVFGAYITYMYIVQLKFSTLGVIISAILTFILFGLIFMFSIWWPVRKSTWPQAKIICTIGASYIIQEACRLKWGNMPLIMPDTIKGAIKVGSVNLSYQYIIIFVFCSVILLTVYYLYQKSFLGIIMQAAAQDKHAATIIGIPVTVTIAITYCLVVTIMGFSGYLVSPLFFVSGNIGSFTLISFAGVVIGGYGSIKGAIIGSLIVGLIESYSAYFTSTYKAAFVFGALLIMLIFRPQGIFGEEISEKA